MFSFEYDPSSGVCYRNLGFMGYPLYRVGDDGSIWSRQSFGPRKHRKPRPTWKKLRLHRSNNFGHLFTSLFNDDGPTSFLVHRVVLSAFTGPCPEGMECRHFPDHDPTNNRLENLQWGTHTQNIADCIAQGTAKVGEKCHLAKIKDSDVPEIHRLRSSGMTYAAIAEIYGVTLQAIRYIVIGATFKHCQPKQ